MSARRDLQAKIAEQDKTIERMTTEVAEQKAETKSVVDDLRIRLRHNRLLNAAMRAGSRLPSLPPIQLPWKHD